MQNMKTLLLIIINITINAKLSYISLIFVFNFQHYLLIITFQLTSVIN